MISGTASHCVYFGLSISSGSYDGKQDDVRGLNPVAFTYLHKQRICNRDSLSPFFFVHWKIQSSFRKSRKISFKLYGTRFTASISIQKEQTPIRDAYSTPPINRGNRNGATEVGNFLTWKSNQPLGIPQDLKSVLQDFTIAFMIDQPKDVITYGVSYFQNLKVMRSAVIDRSQRRSEGMFVSIDYR